MNMEYCIFENTARDMQQARGKLRDYLNSNVTELDNASERLAMVTYAIECLHVVNILRTASWSETELTPAAIASFLEHVIAENETAIEASIEEN